jgi:aminoglycoside 6'-N-acetyltransferase I
MTIVVRPAREADRPEWLRMRRLLWPECSEDDHAAEMGDYLRSATTAVFVAEREGGLAGFVEASIRRDAEGCVSGPVGYVEGWFVDADQRRRGIGRQLVRAAEDWARAKGCREMGSDAEVENAVSRLAHACLGYREVIRLAHFSKPLGPVAPAPPRPRWAAGAVLLETERLFLRQWVPDDWVRFRPLGTDPRVLEFLAGDPWPDERIRRFIERGMEMTQARGWILWPVIHRGDGVLVGFCGFTDERAPEVEIGWRFLPDYWGRGLATEAAAAVLKYGFEAFGFPRVISVAHHSNRRSIRVMEKLGMAFERRFVDRGIEIVQYARANPYGAGVMGESEASLAASAFPSRAA